MPNLPATMACPTCGNREETLTWCGDKLDCDCGERFTPDPWCGACGGRGYVDREFVDWVPYGSTNVQNRIVEREECACAGHCPKCGAETDEPCPVCGYEVNWEGPDNFITEGDDR